MYESVLNSPCMIKYVMSVSVYEAE